MSSPRPRPISARLPSAPALAMALLLAGGSLASAGCQSPCDVVADVTCEAAGETSDACTQIRKKASRATPEVKAACAAAVELRESLAKAR